MGAIIRQYLAGLLVLTFLLVVGTIGYSSIEGWDLFDSLYMTVITLTTVGYGEVHTLSVPGKIFNMGLILSGVTVATYTASRLISNLANIDFDKRRRKKMQKKVDRLKGHTIICGFGRMGEIICQELYKNKIDFVVIESREEVIKRLKNKEYLFIDGDAAHDDNLIAAGIERANVLVSAIDNDSDGLYITLAGRSMNKSLYITIRANDTKAKARMIRAGADRVILPHIMSGKKVAYSVINSAVEDFFDLTNSEEDGPNRLQLADLFVCKDSLIFQKTIREVGDSIRNLIIVGIRDRNKEFQFKPPSDYRFQDGDCLIAMGTADSYHDAKEKLNLRYRPIG